MQKVEKTKIIPDEIIMSKVLIIENQYAMINNALSELLGVNLIVQYW